MLTSGAVSSSHGLPLHVSLMNAFKTLVLDSCHYSVIPTGGNLVFELELISVQQRGLELVT